MFRNFLKVTFRNLWKSKTYSFLNIFGLAIGVACAGLIFLWVEDEKSYDEMYVNKDLIYHVRTNQVYDGMIRTFSSSPGPLAPALKAEVTGVVASTRIQNNQPLFSVGETSLFQRGAYVDSGFFQMMNTKFIEGNPATALKDINSVVLTRKMANIFFGTDRNIVGKTMKVNDADEYMVSAVVEDLPSNSTVQYAFLCSFEAILKERPWLVNWGNNSTDTYIELAPAANVEAVRLQLHNFLQKRAPTQETRLIMVSMNDWRLRDNFENGKQSGGKIIYIRMFSIIAWIILLIACINFMNLATARSEKRMREVGVRKVLGAEKKSLILQFIAEAVFTAAIAVTVGLGLIALLLPMFNTIVEKQMLLDIANPFHFSVAILVALICGLVAGSYPALYLSSFKPVQVFKGLKIKNSSASLIRKGLVVVQFTISIVLIIGTIIIYQQIRHVRDRNIGYDKGNLLFLPMRGNINDHYPQVRQELMNTGKLENVGATSYNTVGMGNNTTSFTWEGKDPSKTVLISFRDIDQNFIPTMKMEMVEGRNFNQDKGPDSSYVIITEAFAKMMGPGSAIGKIIRIEHDPTDKDDPKAVVIGVVKDLQYGDMYAKSDPIIFYDSPHQSKFIYVRIKPGVATTTALSAMETVMKQNNPAYPLEYTFVDDQFNERFKSEMLIGRLSRIFAGLAIIISCLGLFGLSAYTAERRTREIGIRKVLGASVSGITSLLSREFLVLVAISTIIAFPIAWWAMNNWLQGYAYRIEISWMVFVLAAVIALLIAIITISFQSIKAAIANPVKSLRTE
jgi:putative ABC transport system permease protein